MLHTQHHWYGCEKLSIPSYVCGKAITKLLSLLNVVDFLYNEILSIHKHVVTERPTIYFFTFLC